MSQGANVLSLTYDSEHARLVQTLTYATSITTTTYLGDPASGSMSEKVVVGAATTWNDYLMADGRMIGERICISASPTCTGTPTFEYFVADHLNSIAVVTDSSGHVGPGDRQSFDAWGRERNEDGSDDPTCSDGSSAPTSRGFTAQEEIPSFCLVDLNARLYDPTLGRFLSADTIVPDPTDGQSYNRYTYVRNRPLSVTDPTGNSDYPFLPPDSYPNASCEGNCGSTTFSGTIDSNGTVNITKITLNFNSNGEIAQSFNEQSSSSGDPSLGAQKSNSELADGASDPAKTKSSPSTENAQGDGQADAEDSKSSRIQLAQADAEPDEDIERPEDEGIREWQRGVDDSPPPPSVNHGNEDSAPEIKIDPATGTVIIINRGDWQAPKQGPSDSIYEQVDPDTGKVRSRTFYDSNGNPISRQDFDHSHGGMQPHEHLFQFYPNGMPMKPRETRPLPPGYDNTPSM